MRVVLPVIGAALLLGCGYSGEPKPPALKRPMRVTDLAAVERGDKIVVTFTLPGETTEGIRLEKVPDTELRIGASPTVWEQNEWERASDRIPVPPGQSDEATYAKPKPQPKRKPAPPAIAPPPLLTVPSAAMAASGGTRPARRGANPASGRGGARARSGRNARASAQAAAKEAIPPPIVRTVAIDAAKYVGKSVIVGVRIHGPSGRDDGWSNLVPLEVVIPLTTPQNVVASDAREAVHLQWTGTAPEYRIFRRPAADTEWVRVGESTKSSYDDTPVEYGKTWQYYVQSAQKAGAAVAESEPSQTVNWEPKDRFAPAVPTGLLALGGAHTIDLIWDRVTDADLAGYRIYRNGVRIADAVLAPNYSDKDVTVGSRYRYQVSAVDEAGNESEKSPLVEIVME